MDKEIEKEIKVQVLTESNNFLRPLVFTAVGVVLAMLLGVFTVVNGVVSSKVDGLEKTMNAKFETVNAKFDAQMQTLQSIERRLPK